MRPVLFQLAGFAVPAYGATLVVVFVAGFALLRWRARRAGAAIDDSHIVDLAVIAALVIVGWILLGMGLAHFGLAGSPHISSLPILAVGAFAYLAYMRRQRLMAEKLFDIVAPIVAFALAVQFGVGTLLAGTAFGKPTTLAWGLSFPPGSPAHRVYGETPLHPTQLLIGAGMLAIGVVSWLAPLRSKPGQRALLTFIAIAGVYLAVSSLRGNTTSFLTHGVPRTSEVAAAFIVVYCSLMAWRRRDRIRHQGAAQHGGISDRETKP